MIGVFVDGSYLWQAWRTLTSSYVEYAQLLRLIKERCSDPTAIAYYFDARRPRVDCEGRERVLRRAGFRVRTNYPVVQEIAHGADGRPVIDPATGKALVLERQKGVDVGLALEITRSLQRDRWTQLVLIAGDADFAELVLPKSSLSRGSTGRSLGPR